MSMNNIEKTAKESSASRLLASFEELSRKAQEIAAIVEDRTESVTDTRPVPTDKEKDKNEVESYLPSLFERLRESAWAIDAALNKISDIMRRLEL